MRAIKNSMLTNKILKVYFIFHVDFSCRLFMFTLFFRYESGEENRKLRRIQKDEEIKPLSCAN